MTKRLLVLSLTLMLLFAACGQAEENPYAEKVEINWLGFFTSNLTVSPDTDIEKLLEERFNVNINPITDVSQENFSLYVSSGDVLNATFYTSYLHNSSNFSYMYDQGLIREIPEEWLYTYYPTGMKLLKEEIGEEFFENGYHKVDGRVLYVPHVEPLNTTQYVVVYRKDWLDHLGLSEPTTLDEFHDMLYAFTYNDPDGNGKNDTYGIDATTAWMGLWPVYGAFGFVNDTGAGQFLKQEDGSVVYTTATEAYRQALEVIAQWYQEGIIDPECITDNRSAVRTKWANGSTGAMVDSATWFLSYRGSSSIVNMAEEVFGADTVQVMGPLTSQYGDGTVYSARRFPTVHTNHAIVFTASATDEQIIRVLQILEGMASDEELMTRVMYGEDGVDYTWSEDGKQLIANKDVSVEYKAKKGIGPSFYGLAQIMPSVIEISYSDRDNDNLEKISHWQQLVWSNNFPQVTNEAYDTYYAEIKKIEAEFYSNVLMGKQDVNADWADYLKRMDNAGLGKILEEYARLLGK